MGGDSVEGGCFVRFGEQAFCDLAVEVLPDGFQGFFQLLGLRIDEADGESFLCEYVCDTISHGTGADNGDVLHMA